MITESRPLTEIEKATWDAYEWALDQVPNGRAYDRVSIHEAFPDVKAAFEKCQSLQSYHALTKDYDNTGTE